MGAVIFLGVLVDQILGSAQKKAAGAHPCAYRARADRNGEIDSALKKALGIATHPMEPSLEDSMRLVKNSTLYKEFLAERKEILCHKWIESEKAGYDIGFDCA
jgi:hypothetical protein